MKHLIGFSIAWLVGGGASSLADTGGAAVATCHPGVGDDARFVYEGHYGGWMLSPWSGPTGLALCSGGVRLTPDSPRTLYLDYFDGSTTAQVACTAYVLSWDGNAVWWTGATRRSSASGATNGTFSWSIPANQLGYIDIECSVPADDDGAYGKVGSGILGVNLL